MNEASVDIVVDPHSENARLVFRGDLTFSHISSVKVKLEGFLLDWRGRSLVMDIENVTALDLSFLQLIEATIVFLEQHGKEYSLNWDIEEELKDLLLRTGFEKYV